MKRSKKITSLFAAMLMLVTALTGAVPAYAKSAYGSISCSNQSASCSLISNNKNTASAKTSAFYKFDYIYAYVIGCEVDSRGEVVRYISGTPAEKTSATSSGETKISTKSTANCFENLASAHIVKKGSCEKSLPLELHW